MIKYIKPFEEISVRNSTLIKAGWLGLIVSLWIASGFHDVHIFPTIPQVLNGFKQFWNEGGIVHLLSSLTLFVEAVGISIVISLILSYSVSLSILNPIGNFISKMRYLPLTGIGFYISIFINDGRSIQISVLVVFMTTFLTTSIIQIINEIVNNGDEIDHARSLGCSRWEILWEVVIKGRIDYVIEAIRQNLAIVWMSVVTVESILVSAGGLGVLIKQGSKLGNEGKVIAMQIIIILIGISTDVLLTKVRKLIFRYSKF